MNAKRIIRWVAVVAIALSSPSLLTFAQLATGTILGVVKDPLGTVIPGATLVARDIDTGQIREVKSEGDGSYRIALLPVGRYALNVQHDGFSSVDMTDITLTVAAEVTVNVTLQVGRVSQSITVSADLTGVDSTSGSIASLVDERQLSDLPLNGRNYLDLMLLQPGILQQSNKKAGAAQLGTWFSSNGAPVRSNNILLDGAALQNMLGANSSSASGSSLGVDGLKEWRVVTNAFNAEYGMTMGSQILMVSKGGTNQFHGNAFEYLRNEVLDAANYFHVPVAANGFQRIPPFKRNDFGGSFGGPIVKDKVFFYGVYENLRQRLGITTINNTISAADHATTGNPGCTLCPNGTVAPVMLPFLALYPSPNLPNNQYTFPYSEPTNEQYGQIRVDGNLSEKDNVFSRYTVDDTAQIQPPLFPVFSDQGFYSRAQYLTLAENHIFSANLLNSARTSFSRTNLYQSNPPVGLDTPQYSFIAGEQMGTMSLGGLTSIGGDGKPIPVQDFKQNIFTWSDDLTYTRGKHSFKFGTLINHYQLFMIRGSNQQGTVAFADLNHFLAGFPSSYNIAFAAPSITDRTYHNDTFGFYAQDDWRVFPTLTLNLGLRYEIATTYNETHNHGASFRNIVTDTAPTVGAPFKNPSLANIGPRVGFAWDVAGNGKTVVKSGFGLLYDVGSMGTALFIGSAIPPFAFNDSVSISAQNVPLTLPLSFPASSVGKSFSGINWNVKQPYMLQYNLAVQQELPWKMSLNIAYGGSRGVHLMQVTEGNPTIPTITNGQPYWLPTCAVGKSLPTCSPRLNNAWSTYTMETSGADSHFNSMQVQLTRRMSRGLELQAVYTWATAFDDVQGQASGETSSSPVYPSYPQDVHLDYGPSAFNATNNIRINGIYQFKDFRNRSGFLGAALSGWSVTDILTDQSGFPFTPVIQSNRSRSGVNGGGATAGSGSATSDRPNLAPGRSIYSITHGSSAGCTGSTGGRLGTPQLFLDPCAFALQPIGTLGNMRRNSLVGPGVVDDDFSIIKDTPLKFWEGSSLEFRAELFNLLNHPNFATPSVGVSNSAAVVFAGTASDTGTPLPKVGVLNATSIDNREVQLALKLIF